MTKVVINKKGFKVNGGKEFELPQMSVRKHRELLEEMATEKDKLTSQEYIIEMQRRLVHKAINEIDKSITIEGIEEHLHPDEFTKLADALWEAGKADDESKFRIGDKK